MTDTISSAVISGIVMQSSPPRKHCVTIEITAAEVYTCMQLFQERLSKRSVKVYATTPKGSLVHIIKKYFNKSPLQNMCGTYYCCFLLVHAEINSPATVLKYHELRSSNSELHAPLPIIPFGIAVYTFIL